MSYKKWIIPHIDKGEINALAEECGYDPFVTLLAYCRGYNDPFSLDMFLSKELPDLDPYAFNDMEKAVDRIKFAIENREKITVFGDYDCDGVTSTALMFNFLSSLGAEVDYYIPNRKEGYGISLSAVENIASNGTKLIITVDNGITADEEINRASELGIDTVITDHHLPQGALPNAVAVINPHREDSLLDFKDFAGVGVAFMLAIALSELSPEVMLSKYSDLVALGTIADIMPLKAENRGIVSAGVRKIIQNPNLGIKELLVSSGIDLKKVNSTTVAFTLAPRINAAGRMGDAKRAVKILTLTDILEVQRLADELNEENRKRQEIEKQIIASAIENINRNKLYNNRVIVVMGQNWHEGVLGIAAGKLAEHYGKPVILFSLENNCDIAKGSARSVGNFKIFNSIAAAGEFLVKFGGHDMAAGLSIDKNKLESFRTKINEYAAETDYPVPEIYIDCKLNPASISLELINALTPLEPFGSGNASPIFGLFNMTLVRIIPMGNNKHLRLILSKNNATVAAVMFNKSSDDFAFAEGSIIDLAVSLQIGEYQGEPQINVLVKDVKKSGLDDTKVIEDFENYDLFINGNISKKTVKNAVFERKDMAEVYRSVKSGLNSVAKLFCSNLNFDILKLLVIVDTMEELKLIKTTDFGLDRKITLCETGKVDIESSEIYSNLKALAKEECI